MSAEEIQIIIPDTSTVDLSNNTTAIALQLHATRQGKSVHIPEGGITDAEVDSISQSKIEGLLEALASVGATEPHRDVLNPDDAPNFNLTAIPPNPEFLELYVNGQRQVFGVDFNVNGSVLQWSGYPLKSGWTIEAFY